MAINDPVSRLCNEAPAPIDGITRPYKYLPPFVPFVLLQLLRNKNPIAGPSHRYNVYKILYLDVNSITLYAVTRSIAITMHAYAL